MRGWLYLSAGKYADALKVVESLRIPLAADSGLRLLACTTHLQTGAYDQAIADCERAVAGGDDWIGFADMTAAYAMRGNAEKAAQAKARLIAIVPAFTISRYEGKRFFITPEAVARDREHMVAGLRKAGVPE